MTLDEGFTWAAASQGISRLLQLQPMLDSGKLALYDLLLHYWIELFGDTLRSMRGFSAAIDTVSILLLFLLVRRIYRAFDEQSSSTGELAGGFAALLFAINAGIVESARTARMYSLMIAAALLQMLFFVRTQRQGRVSDAVLTAFFLALAIAANFTAGFLLIGEALWLVYLLIVRRTRVPAAAARTFAPAISLLCGLGLLFPWRRAATSLLRVQMRSRDFGWIPYQPPLRWFYDVLRASTNNALIFALLLALAAFALWRHRSKASLVPMFMATMMVGPLTGVALATLFGVPMMVDRYVLIAVVAFLALAAIGAASFESPVLLIAIFGSIMCSARPFSPPAVDWRGAASIAVGNSFANQQIGVAPVFALDVVRYHLPLNRRPSAIGLNSNCGDPHVLIVSPGSIPLSSMSALKSCYPHLLGRDHFLEIRSR